MLALVSCAPEPVTEQGRDVSRLYDIFAILAVAIFLLVAGLIAWSIVRYRDRPGRTDEAAGFSHNRKLEIVWFAIPQAIVVLLFALTLSTDQRVTAKAPAPTVRIDVDAYQWGWRFSYPDEAVSISGTPERPAEIAVPVGHEVAFMLEAEDVIHSFYVPRFLIKRDAIPGETERVDVTVEEAGTYRGVCAEFCGLLHDEMLFSIVAVDEAGYEDWLNLQRAADGDD